MSRWKRNIGLDGIQFNSALKTLFEMSSDQINQLSGKGKVAPAAPKGLVYLTNGKHIHFILGPLLCSMVSLQIDLGDAHAFRIH